MKNINIWINSIGALPLLLLAGCGGSSSGAIASSPSSSTSYTQVERLGRPAINEGLISSNSNLNLWNSVPPSADLGSGGTAIVSEAGGTLGAIYTYSTGAVGSAASLVPPATSLIVSGFLPDVMRVDLTVASTGNTAGVTTIDATRGYSHCLSATKGILCGGRKLNDNVAQITINYLADGTTHALAGVTYNPTGTQAPPTLLTAFPYEAAPN